ncbi:hypothetical protein OQA88_9192 [Cercophora sp. LCS_1]
MARLIHGVAVSSPTTGHTNSLTDLNRLLSRLQQTILRADAEREARLRSSEFEREKARTNIRYAQSLLTKLEQEAALTIKIHTRRQELQTDLVQKREILEQISDRITNLSEIASASTNDSDDASSSEEDILADIIATPSESLNSSTRSPDVVPQESVDDTTQPSPIASQPPPLPVPKPQRKSSVSEKPAPSPQPTDTETKTEQTLRSRRPEPVSEKPTATTTSALFGDRTTTDVSATATTEAILDNQRAEQDLLSESILKLASDLKASSQAFQASLDEDKEVVDRAGQGMNKTGQGMDAVTKRMGTLQRMTEGEGWWGRMILYAEVYGLMVVLVLIVFVLPKLRF